MAPKRTQSEMSQTEIDQRLKEIDLAMSVIETEIKRIKKASNGLRVNSITETAKVQEELIDPTVDSDGFIQFANDRSHFYFASLMLAEIGRQRMNHKICTYLCGMASTWSGETEETLQTALQEFAVYWDLYPIKCAGKWRVGETVEKFKNLESAFIEIGAEFVSAFELLVKGQMERTEGLLCRAKLLKDSPVFAKRLYRFTNVQMD